MKEQYDCGLFNINEYGRIITKLNYTNLHTMYGRCIIYNNTTYLFDIDQKYKNLVEKYASENCNVIISSEHYRHRVFLSENVIIYKSELYNLDSTSLEFMQMILDDFLRIENINNIDSDDEDYRIGLLINKIRQRKLEYIETI